MKSGGEPWRVLGVDFELGPDDLAARGNLSSSIPRKSTDRRAGRIATEINQELACLLETIKVEEVEIFIKPVKEHRFAFIVTPLVQNDALSSETDPQKIGVALFL